METFEATTEDGGKYSYQIDQSGDTIGYNMYTGPITAPIESILKLITGEILKKIYLTGKDFQSLKQCNLNKEELIGKYFDRDGYIYYTNGNQINRFNMKLKYFEKIYRTDRKGKITYKHPHAGLCIVEFDDGSLAAIDIDVKEILLESGENISFFWDVVDRRGDTRGWHIEKLKSPISFSELKEYKHSKEYNICNP